MRRILVVSAVIVFLGAVGMAQNAMDFHALKQDTLVFERIVNERLQQAFSNPFAVTEEPQASYIQGYGIVVSFHLNINRAMIRTPFGEVEMKTRYANDKTKNLVREKTEDQLVKVRQVIVDCLGQYASAIKQLGAHDRVSISAHIEDRNELDPVKKKTVLIVTVTRDNVDLLAMRRISAEEFNRKLHILQY